MQPPVKVRPDISFSNFFESMITGVAAFCSSCGSWDEGLTMGNQQQLQLFRRSTRLERDGTVEGLTGYIPTPRGLELVGQLLDVLASNDYKAFSVTGPYGSGKSSFAVFLSALFEPQASSAHQAALALLEAESGPMARSVADLALLYSVQAGHAHPGDPMAYPWDASGLRDLGAADLGQLTIAYSEDLGSAPIDDGIRRVFRSRMDKVKHAFKAARADSPDITGVREANWVMRSLYYVAYHRERVEKHRDLLAQTIITNTEEGLAMSLADVAEAEATIADAYRTRLY